MTKLTQITNWTAARSGAAITVNGQYEDGEALKVGDIRTMRPSREHPGAVLAITRDGDSYLLLTK
jgi:hypothetical protein